ncbi:MAG: hypothetical protein QOG00_56 [Pyrinomonadaceae bacterium]|nr:hypothetical protein [Pyrinomonadaceae bacterium]
MFRHALFRHAVALATVALACLAVGVRANAQERDAPKVEISGQFTSLEVRVPTDFGLFGSTEPGVGGRIGYNVTDFFGVEAELNLFPQRISTGGMKQGQFGVKAGKRWRKFGLFAKARPGFVSFDQVTTPVGTETFTAQNGSVFVYDVYGTRRRTLFSTDVGGVVEFYPARNLLVRVDAGDTITRYRAKETRLHNGTIFRDFPNRVTHNFQITTGVAYRFLNPKGADEAEPPVPTRGTPRFEAGIQYTTLVLNLPTEIGNFFGCGCAGQTSQPALGGRLTFNLNDHVALEGAFDFLRKENFGSRVTFGKQIAQGQFGVKAGRRFERFGIFGKARPGFLHNTDVLQVVGTRLETQFFPGETVVVSVFGFKNKTYFEMDLGGVAEFYPSRRVVTRFDIGDTIIRYRGRVQNSFGLRQSVIIQPDETRHNLQFTAGVGFRF